MTNPFDDPEGRFHVLANAQGQHSLWPVFLDAPDGWRTVLEDESRDACTAYVREHWDDPATIGVGPRDV